MVFILSEKRPESDVIQFESLCVCLYLLLKSLLKVRCHILVALLGFSQWDAHFRQEPFEFTLASFFPDSEPSCDVSRMLHAFVEIPVPYQVEVVAKSQYKIRVLNEFG